ncbi:hypothetical protein MN116_001336 [Schistosoma mekongi]|uniref:Uncharacterized protein n=1 Tax=Schistosoma mekongi TaxID=38744 RepID=A0AAE1ZL40_SCHME|nr:hypothetical protein MN116_001336 [Schistosoma mekongi]
MGLAESKVSAFASTTSTSEYNKSYGEESQERFLKNDEKHEIEIIDRKFNNTFGDNQDNNLMTKSTILRKTISNTNKPNKIYYSVDNSLECVKQPSLLLRNSLNSSYVTNHCNQTRKQAPTIRSIQKPLVSNISSSSTCNIDTNNNTCRLPTAKLTKTPSPQKPSSNGMRSKVSSEWSDTPEMNSRQSHINHNCRPQSNLLSTEKTGLLHKDMIEF